MKKLILVASAVALFATACQQTPSEASAPAASSASVAAIASGEIAYFNIDSLVSGYNMYTELRSEFEAKAQKADSEVTTKARALETQIASYQEKVQKGLVTRAQAAELEQSLGTQQQEFVQYRDQLVSELAEQEQVMLNNIQHSIMEYISEFNSDYRYGMIISTSNSGPVYSANPSLNITADILSGLNAKYSASK